MGDLERGSYPLYYAVRKLLGNASNNAQSNLTARSNLEIPFIGSLQDGTALSTGKVTLVPVPIEYGDVVNFVDVFVGATAAGTPTHSWAALYNEAGALVGAQSVDGGSAAIAASAKFTFTLGQKYLANPIDSPRGLLYVGVSVTATTPPSLVSGTVPTAAQASMPWYTNAAAFMASAFGSGLGASAPASETLSGGTTQAAVPIVVLR